MVLELAAPASAGPLLQRSIPHIERVFRVRVSCSSADTHTHPHTHTATGAHTDTDPRSDPETGGVVVVIIQDGTEEDCSRAKVSAQGPDSITMCLLRTCCRGPPSPAHLQLHHALLYPQTSYRLLLCKV